MLLLWPETFLFSDHPLHHLFELLVLHCKFHDIQPTLYVFPSTENGGSKVCIGNAVSSREIIKNGLKTSNFGSKNDENVVYGIKIHTKARLPSNLLRRLLKCGI